MSLVANPVAFTVTFPVAYTVAFAIAFAVVVTSDVHRLSQTGELIRDWPSLSGFGLSSSYNFYKVTGSWITTVILLIELI